MNQDPNPPADAIGNLTREFSKLPGIGPKSAQRITFHLLRSPDEKTKSLAEALLSLKQRVTLCSSCCNVTESDPCPICRNPQRDTSQLCIVEQPQDILALEHTGVYKGLYHVLHGAISPTEGVGYNPVELCTVMTDGTVEAHDVLRIAGDGFTQTKFNIFDHALDDVRGEQRWQAARDASINLAAKCRQCKFMNACGGGYLPHRFSKSNGYDNPSVYCDDLYAMFENMQSVLEQHLYVNKPGGERVAMREALAQTAAEHLDVSPEQFRFEEGLVRYDGPSVPLGEGVGWRVATSSLVWAGASCTWKESRPSVGVTCRGPKLSSRRSVTL